MFGGLKPSATGKDLAWSQIVGKSLALKDKCIKQHSFYNQKSHIKAGDTPIGLSDVDREFIQLIDGLFMMMTDKLL